MTEEVYRLPKDETIIFCVQLPEKTWNKVMKYVLKKRMLLHEAILFLTEKGLEAEGEEK